MIIVAIMYFYIILHNLIYVNFELNWLKCSVLFIYYFLLYKHAIALSEEIWMTMNLSTWFQSQDMHNLEGYYLQGTQQVSTPRQEPDGSPKSNVIHTSLSVKNRITYLTHCHT